MRPLRVVPRSAALIVMAIALWVTSGCAGGPWRVDTAWGHPVMLRSHQDVELTGELLGLVTDGVVILTNAYSADGSRRPRITYSSFEALSRIQIRSNSSAGRELTFLARDQFRDTYIGSAPMMQRASYYSRYPRGLDTPLLEGLLRAYGQEAVDTFPRAESGGDQLLLSAAQGIAHRLSTPRLAAEAGYHRIGPDFPGMGQHWVSFQILMSGSHEVDRPAVLSFATVDGETRLVNVAHVVVLPDGGQPQALFGVGISDWHVHGGTVQDEMLNPHRGGAAEEGEGTQVSMLHVWTVPNPEGVLAQQNWLLPLMRLGLPGTSGAVGESAGQALSLATAEGLSYHLEVVRALFPGDGQAEALEVVQNGANQVAGLLGHSPPAGIDLARLGAIWKNTGLALAGLAPNAEMRARVVALHGLDVHRHGGP